MISVKYMSTLIKIMKAMNCDRYIILPDRIIGSDNNVVSITETYINTMIEEPYFEINKDILKELDDTIKKYTSNVKDKSILDTAMVDNLIKYRSITRLGDIDIISIYMRICNNINSNYIISSNDDIKQDENFNYCLSLKSKDGLGRYIYDNKFISIFSGLLPINKADKVSLEVYKSDNDTFLCRFIINKKYAILNKYLRYLTI